MSKTKVCKGDYRKWSLACRFGVSSRLGLCAAVPHGAQHGSVLTLRAHCMLKHMGAAVSRAGGACVARGIQAVNMKAANERVKSFERGEKCQT